MPPYINMNGDIRLDFSEIGNDFYTPGFLMRPTSFPFLYTSNFYVDRDNNFYYEDSNETKRGDPRWVGDTVRFHGR
jgi:hypothetical protein